jgi:transposase
MTKYVIDNSFKSLIKDIIKNNKRLNNRYFKCHPNSRYKIDDILDDILYVLKTGISWRDIRSHINWNTLYQHFKGMIDEKIFFKLFKVLQKRYLKSNYINTLIIDSSFIPNKYGRDKISRNKFYKNKKGNKIYACKS